VRSAAEVDEVRRLSRLGLYLGDGHVVSTGRSYRLTIKLDAVYPGIVKAAAAAVAAVLPGHAVAVRPHPTQRCVAVSTHSILWPQLLPQHGPGRKHTRPIRPTPWQLKITRVEPRALVRGLIHSDGSRYVAVVRRRGRTYSYARYSFANRSDDIKGDLLRAPRSARHPLDAPEREGHRYRPEG